MFRRRVFLVAVFFSGLAVAAEEQSIRDDQSFGSVDLNFRYRFEHVDQDGFDKAAQASTLKSRITFESTDFKGFSLLLEADDVTYIGDDDFNNTRNGHTNYPVVADPDGTHLNRALIRYQMENSALSLGRQRINLGDQRFVGGVAWRQNEQTFDAVRLQHSRENWHFDYSFVNRVSRIFGPDDGVPSDSLDSDVHLLNVQLVLPHAATLTGYYYAMDLEDADRLSSQTQGLRYQQTFETGGASWPLLIEYAEQNDHGDNPVSYDASYARIQFGYKREKFALNLGYELLEGNSRPGSAFRTPLATLHKFQGWTDKFLNTPDQGVEDAYISLKWGTISITWHDFNAESGGGSYGDEWGLLWTHKFNEHFSLLAKYASYQSDELATDTRKGWLTLSANF